MIVLREFFPIHLRKNFIQGPAFSAGLHAQQPGDSLVEVNDTPQFIHHQNTVFNGVEQGFQKAAFARQTLHDRLQTFLVQATDAPENLVEKTGFGSRHVQNQLRLRRYQ